MGIYESDLPCGCTVTTCTHDYPWETTTSPGCAACISPDCRAVPSRAPRRPTPTNTPIEPAIGGPEGYPAHDEPVETTTFQDDGLVHVRIALQTSAGRYRLVTFVCDTGAPDDLYFGPSSWAALRDDCWLQSTDGPAYRPAAPGGRRVRVDRLVVADYPARKIDPQTHEPYNLMGVRLLAKFGFFLHQDGAGFDALPAFIPWESADSIV